LEDSSLGGPPDRDVNAPDRPGVEVVEDKMRAYEDALPELYQVGYTVAFRMTGSDPDAEDVAQEIAARAMLRWDRIASYAEAWVARSATNLVLDRLRRSKRWTRIAPRLAPSAPRVVGDERIDLVAALSRLPRRQREVVVLRYLADLGEQEVADRLGCTVGSVKQHATRGLAALRLEGGLSMKGSGG
jgi:RNA polymerase sigma factor (sigma-70 family)